MSLALTVNEAVKASGVGRSRLYEAIGDGSLPARKLGRRTLIMVEDLRAWLESLPRLKPSRTGGIGSAAAGRGDGVEIGGRLVIPSGREVGL